MFPRPPNETAGENETATTDRSQITPLTIDRRRGLPVCEQAQAVTSLVRLLKLDDLAQVNSFALRGRDFITMTRSTSAAL
jgi:hypothetical protein